MKEEIAKALAQLVTIFSWIIEAIVAFTLPGIFSISLATWAYPNLYMPTGYFSQVTKLGLFVYAFLWPTILGMVLNELGKHLFAIIGGKLNIAEKAKDSFISQFVDAEVALVEHHYSQNELAHIHALSEKEKSSYFREIVDQQYKTAKESISKRLGKGLMILPKVIIGDSKMRQELGFAIGPSHTLFSFSIGVFAGLMCLAFFSIYANIYTRNYIKLLTTSLPIVALATGAFSMSAANAFDWYANRAAVFLGLSDQHNNASEEQS